jgi:sugar lactone lactonase YvrE
MQSKRIALVDTGEIYANLSELGGEYLNDMVVDEAGRAYVGHVQLPPDRHSVNEESGDSIVCVDPNGTFSCAAKGALHRPNGIAITADGLELIAAMVATKELVSFSRGTDGSLDNRRQFADLGAVGESVDGICVDCERFVWVASPNSGNFVRVGRGGEIAQAVNVPGKHATACVLGGPDRRTLFMATAILPDNPRGGMNGNLNESRGYIEVVDVPVRGAGIP